MKVKLLIPRQCVVNGSQNRGDEIEVSDDEAKRMIAAHQAEPVRSVKREKAVRAPRAEKAVKGG